MDERLVWLITGTSTGLGRELVIAALDRGDQVIATTRARSFNVLSELEEKGAAVLELDVTAPLAQLHATAAAAVKIYGRVDVLVNNAGAYTAAGTMEEQSPEDTIHQFNINVLGPLNVARAFLPYMRERYSGTVVWMGSVAAYHCIPNSGLYCATKAALIRVSEALNMELQPFGVRSICIDLGYYRTNMARLDRLPDLVQTIPAYKEISEKADAYLRTVHGSQPGDPVKCARVLIDVVRGEGTAVGKDVPSRLALGSDAYAIVRQDGVKSLERLEDWKEVIQSTDIEDGVQVQYPV